MKKLFPIILFVFFVQVVFAQENEFVYDQADVLTTAQEDSLKNLLLNYEQATGNQFVLLTIESVGDETTIEDLSVETFEKWGIGQEGKDNGLLVLFSLYDREVRTAVGYGLEHVIPDAYAFRNAQNNGVPYFKEENYAVGLYAMMLGLIQKATPNFTYGDISSVFSSEPIITYVFPDKPDPVPHVIDYDNVLTPEVRSKIETSLKKIEEEEGVPFHVYITNDENQDFDYILKLTSEWDFPGHYEEGEQEYDGVLIYMNLALEKEYSFKDYFTWLGLGDEEFEIRKQTLLDQSKPLEERLVNYCYALIDADNAGFKQVLYIFAIVIVLMIIFTYIAVKWGGKGGGSDRGSRTRIWSSGSDSFGSDSGGSTFGGGSTGGGGSTNRW